MSDRRAILLCIAVFLLAAAATNPVLEMGVNDDVSYTQIARNFAATQHFTYNGWSAVLLIPQIVWAAAFIKLFGFSFMVVRLSTVVLCLFLTPVLYRLGRESGLSAASAAFATLLTTLSPVAMPEAVSFMSDLPSFFLFALCVYGGVRCWKASTAKSCMAWAGLMALAGLLSGLDRQIYWLAPFLFLPVVAWVQRGREGVVTGLGVVWLACAAAVGYAVAWFQAKPYILVEHTLDPWLHAGPRFLAIREISLAGELALTMALVLLPLLAIFVGPAFRTASRRTAVPIAAAVLAVAFAMSHLLHRPAPWLGNILTEQGILGSGPPILGPGIRDLLTVAVLLAAAGCGLTLWRYRGTVAAPILTLGIVFTAAWVAVILYRSASGAAFDRYLIPFMPLIAIPLLRHYEAHVGARIGRVGWAMLALFAMYGVATTHDAFAAARARLTAARNLEQAGIPRTQITAGFEYDYWTQFEAAGYINNPLIENPAGAYRAVHCTGPLAETLARVPTVHPRWFVVQSRLPELVDSGAATVEYVTWLPPGRRQVITQVVPGGGAAGCW